MESDREGSRKEGKERFCLFPIELESLEVQLSLKPFLAEMKFKQAKGEE